MTGIWEHERNVENTSRRRVFLTYLNKIQPLGPACAVVFAAWLVLIAVSRFCSQQIEQRISKQLQKRIKSPTSWKLWQTIVNSFLSGSYNSSSSGKFTTTWNYSFWRRRREVDEEILRSRLRTYFHVTSSRRPPCRRRGCLISVITIQADLLYSQGVYENKLPPAKLTEIENVNVR